MGMMAKMRSLAPWFIITVGGLFVLFMVLSDSQIVNIMGQRSNNIGYVNGEPISYQEFSNYLQVATDQQRQQTGQEIDETRLEMLRDEVWRAYVNQKLIEEKIDEFGIVVSNEEVTETILGPNPPAFLRQSFLDSAGVFNREAYEQALFNPQNEQALIQAEETVRQQKVQEKLRNIVTGAVVVSEGEIRRKFVEQNTKVSAEYAMIDSRNIPDSMISVSDEDLKEYYNENKSDYKVEPKRKLKYVLFERSASQEDSAAVRTNLEAIVKDLKADTATFKTYVNIYSEQPYSLDTLSVDKVHPNAVNILEEAEQGEIIGPVLTTEGYTVYKLVNRIKSSDEFARASHILISGTGDESKEKADSVYQALMSGADFDQTAIEISEDPGSGSRGGDLGWFGKGQMVPEFENAVFSGKVGEIQKPVMSQFGYHIILVENRSSSKFVVEKIVNSIQPSGTTLDRIYENANDFAYLAGENGFESEAELMEYDIKETPQGFTEDASFIPGIGQSNALLRFTFDNSVGDVSEVIRIPAGYVVAKISESTKAGFQTFDEVKTQVQNAVKTEKKLAKAMEILGSVYSKVKDNAQLDQAPQMNSLVKFDRIESFTVNRSIPKIGKDEAFTAYILDGEINKVSKPIEGSRYAYIIKVTDRTAFDDQMYAQQKETLRETLLQQKKSQIYVEWLDNLRDDADIVDNRHLFYR